MFATTTTFAVVIYHKTIDYHESVSGERKFKILKQLDMSHREIPSVLQWQQ